MTEKRKNLLFIAIILALAAVLWLAAHHGGTGRTAVLRYGDPQVEQRIDLRKNAEYDIDTGLYTIHLRVENGGIAFVDSPCPDHLCEGFGTLKNGPLRAPFPNSGQRIRESRYLLSLKP